MVSRWIQMASIVWAIACELELSEMVDLPEPKPISPVLD